MNAEQLLKHYEQVAEAPDAIARLRRLVISLAVRGRLVPQESGDSPHPELLIKLKSSCSAAAGQPLGWAQSAVGSLLDFQYGSGLKAADRLLEGPVAVYGSNGVVGFTDVPLTKKPSIIVGRKGSAGALNICTGPSWTTDVAYFVETPAYFDLRFLFQALTALNLEKLGKGVKPGLSRSDAYALPISVPPLAEQHRIVAKVDELLALCDRLGATRAKREETRDRLTASTLARLNTPEPLASPDFDASKESSFQTDARFALKVLPALTTRPEQIKQLRQTVLGLAFRGGLSPPGEWQDRSVQLRDVASLQNGYAFKSEWFTKVGVRLLRNANVGHGRLNWSEAVCLPIERAGEYERFRLNDGDIVLSLDRPFIATGTKVARVTADDLPTLLLQRVGRFILEPSLCAEYLFLWIISPDFSAQIDPGRSNGVPHISSKQVEAALLLIPPLAEQHRIVAKVDELMSLCDQLEASLTRGENTRSRLLNALLHEALAPAGDIEEAQAA